MHRLTYHHKNGEWGVDGVKLSALPKAVIACVLKLRNYENLGIDPVQVEKLLYEECFTEKSLTIGSIVANRQITAMTSTYALAVNLAISDAPCITFAYDGAGNVYRIRKYATIKAASEGFIAMALHV